MNLTIQPAHPSQIRPLPSLIRPLPNQIPFKSHPRTFSLARGGAASACLEPHTRTHAWEPHTLEHSPIEGTRLLAQGTRSSQLSHILQNAHESPHRKRDRAVSFVLQAAAGERIQSGPGETTQVNASRVEAAIIPPPSAGSYHICRTSRYFVVTAANLVSYQ
jgi:hypothetical protein